MLHAKIIAAIRTGCATLGAAAITFLVAWLTDLGLEVTVDPSWALALSTLLFGVLVALYNFLVGWLTENVWDGFGWLLGINKPPSYITDPGGDLLSAPEQNVAGQVSAVEVDPHASR